MSQARAGGFAHLAETAAQFAATLAGRGCYMGLQVLLARGLGPERFGLYSIGWTVVGLIGTLTPLGMPQATLRFGIGGRGALLGRPVLLVAATSMLAALLLDRAADPLADRVFGEPEAAGVIRDFAPSLVATGLLGVLSAALRASGRIVASAAIGALAFILYLAFAGLGLRLHPGLAVAAGSYAPAVLFALLPCLWLLWRAPGPRGATRPAGRTMLQFGLVTMLIHSSSVLNIWSDRLVIGIMAAPTTLAAYQVASQFAMIMVVLRSAVTTVFEARVPKHQPGRPVPDVSRDFVVATRLMLHVSVPGLIALACAAPVWIGLLFGDAYRSAALPLQVLIAGQIIASLFGPSVTALHMTGSERLVMVLMMLSCLLNLAGTAGLLPLFGATGAALATSLANAGVGLVCLLRLLRSGRLRLAVAQMRDVPLAAGLSLAAGLGVTLTGPGGLGGALLALLACVAVYAAVVALCCRAEDELVQLLRLAGRRLRRATAASRAGRPA